MLAGKPTGAAALKRVGGAFLRGIVHAHNAERPSTHDQRTRFTTRRQSIRARRGHARGASAIPRQRFPVGHGI